MHAFLLLIALLAGAIEPFTHNTAHTATSRHPAQLELEPLLAISLPTRRYLM
jgi:hypothetical protein